MKNEPPSGSRRKFNTTVRPGELIVAISVAASAAARNSTYFKVRLAS